MGGDGRRGRLWPADARRDVALEPRQGPVMGAAPDRTGRRGRLRPSPGRPVSARDDVAAVATRQAARGLPVRPARGDGAVRAGGDLRIWFIDGAWLNCRGGQLPDASCSSGFVAVAFRG